MNPGTKLNAKADAKTEIENQQGRTVAVLIPCYNEEITIAKVVNDTRLYLPMARIYVFDNNSSDQTAVRARAAGAEVICSPIQGKGHVVRHAFRVIDAEIFVLVDGDDTYPMDAAQKLIDQVEAGFDMVVGTRLSEFAPGAFRKFHLFGNRFLSATVSSFFGQRISDMLSGFRAFSREFVEEIPLNSRGFEIETDLTLQAISKNYSICEVPVAYRERPSGSFSKLKTFDDGFLIIKFIFRLVRDFKPFQFFTSLAALFVVMGLVAGYAPIHDYMVSAYVYTVPRAILASGCMLFAVVLFGVGLILDSQNRHFNEQFATAQKLHSAIRKSSSKKTSDQA